MGYRKCEKIKIDLNTEQNSYFIRGQNKNGSVPLFGAILVESEMSALQVSNNRYLQLVLIVPIRGDQVPSPLLSPWP
jgi:hypothetical protein